MNIDEDIQDYANALKENHRRLQPQLTMKNATCIECGGHNGHHFTNCPETPDPDEPATERAICRCCGMTAECTIERAGPICALCMAPPQPKCDFACCNSPRACRMHGECLSTGYANFAIEVGKMESALTQMQHDGETHRQILELCERWFAQDVVIYKDAPISLRSACEYRLATVRKALSPNVKDEPRPQPARLVLQ